MSTYFDNMADAFDVLISSIPNPDNYQILRENDESPTTNNQPHFACFQLFGQTEQVCYGDTGLDATVGIFQVSVKTPLGSGRRYMPLVDTIADHFKRGTVLEYNGVRIRIRSTSVGPGIREENYYTWPVSIDWQSHTPARA